MVSAQDEIDTRVAYRPEVCKTEGYKWKGGCYLPSVPSPRAPTDTGVPSVLIAPASNHHYRHGAPWRLRAGWDPILGFMVVEAEEVPASGEPQSNLRERLELVTEALRDLEGHAAVAAHLQRRPRKPRVQQSQDGAPAVAPRVAVGATEGPASQEETGSSPSLSARGVDSATSQRVSGEPSSPRHMHLGTLRARRSYWAALACTALATLVLVSGELHAPPPHAGVWRRWRGPGGTGGGGSCRAGTAPRGQP